MGLGPIPAIQQLLEQTGMTIDDIDVVEINEAFAAQIVPCKEELGIPDEKLNPFGGAIALGHPFGMTGARIMTTLLNDLRDAGRDLRDRVDVRRRRDGHGDAGRAAVLAADHAVVADRVVRAVVAEADRSPVAGEPGRRARPGGRSGCG